MKKLERSQLKRLLGGNPPAPGSCSATANCRNGSTVTVNCNDSSNNTAQCVGIDYNFVPPPGMGSPPTDGFAYCSNGNGTFNSTSCLIQN